MDWCSWHGGDQTSDRLRARVRSPRSPDRPRAGNPGADRKGLSTPETGWQARARVSPGLQSKIQPVQNAPAGTPSGGRPKGKVPTKKTPQTPAKKNTTQLKTKTKPQKTASISDVVKDMTDVEFADFQYELNKLRIDSEED